MPGRAGLRGDSPMLLPIETDEPVILFIPQPEVQGFQAAAERDRFDPAKNGMRLVAALQVVVRDA